MVLRKMILLLCLLNIGRLYAQSDEFCEAVNVISRDAPDKFRNIRGRMTESNANATMWASGIKVPGSIGSRFVASMGLFYECAFIQTKDKNGLKEPYYMYKNYLTNCLVPFGYKLSEQPNFYPGLDAYKKLVFMQEIKEGTDPGNPPSHITLEATYHKDAGQYTIVMFIFEH